MDDRERLHDRIKEAIYYNPARIGLPKQYLLSKSMEVGLIHNGETIVVPDIRYDYRNGREYTYFVEVKSSNSRKCREKGNIQVQKIISWTYEHEINAKVFLIYPERRTRNFKRILEQLIVEEHQGNW